MKLGLFLVLGYFSMIAHAQEAETVPLPPPAPISEIEKFSYIPPLGVTYVSVGLAYSSSKGEVKGQAGNYSDFKTTLTRFNYLFERGVSDDFALSLQGRILMASKTDYDYGPASASNGTSASYKRTGWEEPEIGAVWRFRDDTSSKIRMHLTAGVRPQLQKAKYATPTADGNGGIGGTQFSAGLGLFKEVKNVELQLSVQRNFLTVAKAESASDSNEVVDEDARQTTDINLGLLAFLSDEFSIGSILFFDITEKYTSTTTTSGTKTSEIEYDAGNFATIELIGKYKLENSSLLRLAVSSPLSWSQKYKRGNTTLERKTDSGTAFTLSWIREF